MKNDDYERIAAYFSSYQRDQINNFISDPVIPYYALKELANRRTD